MHQGLQPGADYWYYVETSGNASDLFHFASMPAGLDWSPKLLVYGDMGKEGGSQSLPALYKEAASGDYNAILHVGDFAYDLDSDGGEVVMVIIRGYCVCTTIILCCVLERMEMSSCAVSSPLLPLFPT